MFRTCRLNELAWAWTTRSFTMKSVDGESVVHRCALKASRVASCRPQLEDMESHKNARLSSLRHLDHLSFGGRRTAQPLFMYWLVLIFSQIC